MQDQSSKRGAHIKLVHFCGPHYLFSSENHGSDGNDANLRSSPFQPSSQGGWCGPRR